MPAPADYLNITDLPEATDLTDLFLAAESSDPSEQTKKIPTSLIGDEASKIANAGDSHLAGGKIWPVDDRSAGIGDIGLVNIQFLKSSDSQFEILGEPVSGDITSLSFANGTATIGGVDVRIVKHVNREIIVVDALGLGGVTNDTAAFKQALKYAEALKYAKQGAKIVARAPVKYYQIDEPLKFGDNNDDTGAWNLDFSIDVPNSWNRTATSPQPEDFGGNIHWIGANNEAVFDFTGYCFGAIFRNISLNGRDKNVRLFDFTRAIISRDITFYNCGGRNGDFSDVYGAVGSNPNPADTGPIVWINPQFHDNKSCGSLNLSGNAYVTMIGGASSNNGYAPTTGHDFITDADNKGYQFNNVAGSFTRLNHTYDASPTKRPASRVTNRVGGGSVSIDGWDDTPQVVSIETNGLVKSLHIGKYEHYDGTMTRVNTPVSIRHNAKCVITTHGGMSLGGDIEIVDGNQATCVDHGAKFLIAGADFSGTGVDVGSLSTNRASGYGEAVRSIAAKPKRFDNALTAIDTKRSRAGGVMDAEQALGSDSNVWNTKTIIANGDTIEFKNSYKSSLDQKEYSIASGPCVKMTRTAQGNIIFSTATATGANQELSWVDKWSLRNLAGPNGDFGLRLGSREFGFDIPADGVAVVQGSIYVSRSASPGGTSFIQVTTSGTKGSTAVLTPMTLN